MRDLVGDGDSLLLIYIDEAREGQIRFRGTALTELSGEAQRATALKVQMIFQDPFASLNPRLRVSDIVQKVAVR